MDLWERNLRWCRAVEGLRGTLRCSISSLICTVKPLCCLSGVAIMEDKISNKTSDLFIFISVEIVVIISNLSVVKASKDPPLAVRVLTTISLRSLNSNYIFFFFPKDFRGRPDSENICFISDMESAWTFLNSEMPSFGRSK